MSSKKMEIKYKNRYQAIKNMELEFHYMMKMGFIPVHILNWKCIYEKYIEKKKTFNKKTDAIKETGIELSVSYKTVERVIKFMTE